MQILSPLATSSEKHEPQWIEFIDMQVRLQVLSLPGATLTAAVPVPDLHAVLLLRDGVDPVIGLTAVPVVVVVGGAVRPLKVTLLVWGEQREAVIAEPCLRWGGPIPRPHPWCHTARGHGEILLPLSKGQTAHSAFTTENLPWKALAFTAFAQGEAQRLNPHIF